MSTLRRSTVYLGMVGALILICAGLLLHASSAIRNARATLARKGDLVRRLSLTDLCLFTEANYTRHLSMADLSTPFQDAPASLEHFPTGALVEPPTHLLRKTRD